MTPTSPAGGSPSGGRGRAGRGGRRPSKRRRLGGLPSPPPPPIPLATLADLPDAALDAIFVRLVRLVAAAAATARLRAVPGGGAGSVANKASGFAPLDGPRRTHVDADAWAAVAAPAGSCRRFSAAFCRAVHGLDVSIPAPPPPAVGGGRSVAEVTLARATAVAGVLRRLPNLCSLSIGAVAGGAPAGVLGGGISLLEL